jgi:hypothetical protein
MSEHLTRGPRSKAELNRDWTWHDMIEAHAIIDASEAAVERERAIRKSRARSGGGR